VAAVPFPTKLLNDNEDVVLDLRPHWSTLAKPVAGVIGALIVTVLLGVVQPNGVPLVFGGVALTVAALVWLGLRYLRWTTTNFVVTTDRLVYRSGVVAKHGKEIPLERVNDIAFKQSVFERLIGTGDLSIESAGAQSRETFSDIPHPAQVQNEIYRQMESSAGRHADRMAGRRELSVPEQLEKLDELRQRGVITQAEFDTKKQQLLQRM
jgi:uncharacterized membrane protein YdbT with pleckstrin-like domain